MSALGASGFATLIPIVLVLACPLLMIVMMRGHGHGHGHGHAAREQPTLEELKRRRDELNVEIAERAEQRAHSTYPGTER